MTASILPPALRGVAKVTGYRGRGKSFFAAQMENPRLTCFFDFEKKGEGINEALHFGRYIPVTELASGGGLGVYDTFMRELAALPAGTYTHVVLDNTAPLEQAMKAEASRNANKYAVQFGMDAGNIRLNKYGGASGVVNYLISDAICNPLWAKGVKLITVTAHIKPRWSGGAQVPNSFNVKGAERWDELSILTLIIIPGDFPPVPSALVMKEQLGSISFDDSAGTFQVQRRLPYRLPRATPQAVYQYLQHPADLAAPAPGEVPSEDEVQPFREKLSKEQLSIVLAEIEANKASEAYPVPAQVPVTVDWAVADLLVEEGKAPAEVAQVLGITVPQYMKAKSERNGK